MAALCFSLSFLLFLSLFLLFLFLFVFFSFFFFLANTPGPQVFCAWPLERER
jgi:hypothetical protein